MIAQLYAEHSKGNLTYGINLDSDGDENLVHDKVKEGVLDALYMKECAFRLAIDAVLTVLRVDQIIMAKVDGSCFGLSSWACVCVSVTVYLLFWIYLPLGNSTIQ